MFLRIVAKLLHQKSGFVDQKNLLFSQELYSSKPGFDTSTNFFRDLVDVGYKYNTYIYIYLTSI